VDARALLLVALLAASGLAFAGSLGPSLALSPPTLDLNDPPVVPGGTRLAHMTVSNAGDEAVDVTTRTAEEAGNWITVDPPTFRLAPQASKQVTLTITVPADARKGSFLGRIDFNPASGGSSASGGSQILSGVSGLVNITVDRVETRDLVIQGMEVPNIHRGEPLAVEVRARNNGNVPDAYHLEVDVMDANRTGVFTHRSFDAKTLASGGNRTDAFDVPVVLADGQYAWNATATLLGTSTVLARQGGFFVIAELGSDFKVGTLPFFSIAPTAAAPGQDIRLTALFRNEGGLVIGSAQFEATVLRDGKQVDTLQADPVRVAPRGNATLLAHYTPTAAGHYLIQGHVLYDGFRTANSEAELQVTATSALPWHGIPTWMWTLLGTILIGTGLIGLLLIRRRERRRDPPPAKGPRTPPPPGLPPARGPSRIPALHAPVRPPVLVSRPRSQPHPMGTPSPSALARPPSGPSPPGKHAATVQDTSAFAIALKKEVGDKRG
jgi:hypothetical protein